VRFLVSLINEPPNLYFVGQFGSDVTYSLNHAFGAENSIYNASVYILDTYLYLITAICNNKIQTDHRR
jgi:hypothetical protein